MNNNIIKTFNKHYKIKYLLYNRKINIYKNFNHNFNNNQMIK